MGYRQGPSTMPRPSPNWCRWPTPATSPRLDLALEVNGQARQHGELRDLIWNVAETLHELSKLYALRAGDLVFMGTPAGVGPLLPGDRFRVWLGAIAGLEGGIVAAGASA